MAKNNITILFWPFKAKLNKKGQVPIYLRISYNYQRKNIATGHFIELNRWDVKKHRVKGSQVDAVGINNYLQHATAQLISLHNELLKEGEIDLDKLLDRFLGRDKKEMTLLELINYHNNDFKKRIGIDYKQSTFDKYNFLHKKLEAFMPYKYGKKDVKLKDLTPVFASDFDYFLKLHDGNKHNTVVKYITNLKKILNMAVMNGWLVKSPFAYVKAVFKDVNRVVLTMQELEVMQKKQFKIERLSLVRDLFIFQCYTGLAFADMAKLKGRDVTIGIDGNKWIITNRQKTDTRSAIPLLPKVIEIIEHYNPSYQVHHENRLLPVYSNQKYNAYLQEIAELCNIPKTITSHVGRRTFATTIALSGGVSIEVISKVLGHSNIKITQQYAQVTDLNVSNEINKLRRLI